MLLSGDKIRCAMSQTEVDSKQHALRREWAAARIVVIGGLVIAVAVAGYFAYQQEQTMRAEQQAALPHTLAPKRIDPKVLARVELAVCSAELKQAINIGIVPTYGQLASRNLQPGNAERRFICQASTHIAHYFIEADVQCNNLADARCVSIYRIALKDGRLLYDRQSGF